MPTFTSEADIRWTFLIDSDTYYTLIVLMKNFFTYEWIFALTVKLGRLYTMELLNRQVDKLT